MAFTNRKSLRKTKGIKITKLGSFVLQTSKLGYKLQLTNVRFLIFNGFLAIAMVFDVLVQFSLPKLR